MEIEGERGKKRRLQSMPNEKDKRKGHIVNITTRKERGE